MKDKCEDYLWDPKAEPDPEIERLESLLSPMRFEPTPLHPRSGKSRILWIAGLAGLAAATLFWLYPLLGSGDQDALVRLRTQEGRVLLANSTFVAGKEGDRLLLGEDGSLADLELSAGSQLAIRSLNRDKAILALQQGAMDAFVSAAAHPGFFNVDTPSTRCVDLGCQYRLTVDPEGKAHVSVLMGRVAFQDDRKPWRKEVFVPQGAVCTADPTRGSGTPRFEDIQEELRVLLDQFDASPIEQAQPRRQLALAFISKADGKEDMLPIWHFLQDPDSRIAKAADAKLSKDFGPLPGISKNERNLIDAKGRALWREHLWPDPYR